MVIDLRGLGCLVGTDTNTRRANSFAVRRNLGGQSPSMYYIKSAYKKCKRCLDFLVLRMMFKLNRKRPHDVKTVFAFAWPRARSLG